MDKLKTKFAPYDDQNIWNLDEDEISDCFDYWLEKSLKGQDLEEFSSSYQCMLFVLHWYINMILDDISYVDFVLFYSSWIYEKEEIFIADCAKPYELAKLIYVDQNLKKYIDSIVKDEIQPYGLHLTPTKRTYLKEALHYAKNFHPNYLPEHLLER